MNKFRFLAVLTAALFFSVNLHAVYTIKMGAIIPEGTPWGKSLNKFVAEARKISGGEVDFKVYYNGVAGGESAQLRKMKIGQLQAGVFSSFGLNEISPDSLAMSTPFLIQSDSELDYVLAKLKPTLEAKLKAKKYKMMAWSRAGWVYFFSKTPIVYPADMRKLKLATNPDDQAFLQAWKSLGYHLVPVAIPDILMSLNSGMIEAVYTSPIAVGGYQWFGIAKYMADMKISPFIGGIVINQDAWDKIPDQYKPKLEVALRTLERELDVDVRKFEQDAITTMKTYGLQITPVPQDAVAAWKKDTEGSMKGILGKSFSKEIYEQIKVYVEEYRKK